MIKIQLDSTGKVYTTQHQAMKWMIQETSGNRMNKVADQTEYE